MVLGFMLDQIVGDPKNFPHPVRLIGRWIGWLDKRLLGEVETPKKREKTPEPENSPRNPLRETLLGVLLVPMVMLPTGIVTTKLLRAAYSKNRYLGMTAEAILYAYLLCAKSLKDESMAVYDALHNGDIEEARKAVSMIVGRDTRELDEAGIIRATVETVAENATDGVIAPMFYTALGGPVLGWLHKASSTMDSMVGYHNDRYEYFGKAAARLDDVLAFVPARLSAILMLVSCLFSRADFDAKNAFTIFKRDRYNHKSPNAAQTESVVAGALHIRLAGPAKYFGKRMDKPFIGDDERPVNAEDIARVNRLMTRTAVLGELFFALLCCGKKRVDKG